MYIEAVPNRKSPPRMLLRETYREGGEVGDRPTLLNLTRWPAEQVEGLRIVLKGGTALPAGERLHHYAVVAPRPCCRRSRRHP